MSTFWDARKRERRIRSPILNTGFDGKTINRYSPHQEQVEDARAFPNVDRRHRRGGHHSDREGVVWWLIPMGRGSLVVEGRLLSVSADGTANVEFEPGELRHIAPGKWHRDRGAALKEAEDAETR